MSDQRLIDANALKAKAFGKRKGLVHTADIDAMPTIKPERPSGREVYQAGYAEGYKAGQAERKTGKWIWKTLDVYRCSECETETHVDECMEEPIYNFCPYCGARLVQEGEDNERA